MTSQCQNFSPDHEFLLVQGCLIMHDLLCCFSGSVGTPLALIADGPIPASRVVFAGWMIFMHLHTCASLVLFPDWSGNETAHRLPSLHGSLDSIATLTEQMIGHKLKTKQTTGDGVLVKRVSTAGSSVSLYRPHSLPGPPCPHL